MIPAPPPPGALPGNRCDDCLTLLPVNSKVCPLGPHDSTCEACGDEFDRDTGCFHDGHVRCACCLDMCSECRDAINDYVRD